MNYKVINCDHHFYCLFDVKTALPSLLAFRYCESELQYKSLNYQKYELEALKAFHEYWIEKFSETLDYSFHQSGYQDVVRVSQEMDAFWDWLLLGRRMTNLRRIGLLGTVSKKSMRTNASRGASVCRFLEFLTKTYINTRYSHEPMNNVTKLNKMLRLQIEEHKKRFQKYSTVSKDTLNSSRFRSLTDDQFRDLLKVFTPDTIKKATNIKQKFVVDSPNLLNPIATFEIQFRNYLMVTLLCRYGLRIGEVLLLHKASFKPYRSDCSKILMLVRNISDSLTDVEDLRKNKPEIKNDASIREIDIDIKDYEKIMLYIEQLRPSLCEHDYVFTSHKSPYFPLSYSTFYAEFSVYSDAFTKHFPRHFELEFAESIIGKVSPHWLRHTWAYNQLKAQYMENRQRYHLDGFVDIKGLMEDAKEHLRTLGGWSEKSDMPAMYARRFVQEEANRTLLDLYYRGNLVEPFKEKS
ncbi:hypothetical protein Q9887_003795 [Vibrio fluvialis]|nr:hypothetical protein [Vibrio fluvialis]